ncbi:sugar ABC transporter substrate-binding protein [Kribbella sp. NBC_01505]|uniref:ABC transporter substrate-binding protein n=1 Tax=Kribbella sp. NBC_01505 TaxID=2903580 RepID=UPI00386DB09E
MPAKLSRRSFLELTGLAGLGAAVTGCSTGPPSGAATWAMWSSSAAEKKVWEDFSQYVEQQLGVKSVPTLTPSSGYPTKLDLQLVSGTASLVTAINGTLIPTYAARGAHRPLDDLIKADPDFDLDDFYPTSQRISSFNGKTYAIGFDVAPTVLYYNKTLLQKQGIALPSRTEPMPWATFRDLAKELTGKDQYGFTCAPAIDDLVSWIYCAGGNVMNDAADRSTLNAPEAMQAIQFVIDLFVKDKVTPPIKNLVTESSLSNFIQGNVAFMQNGPWQVVNVRKAKFDWDVIPFPAGAAGSTPRVSGSSFGIPSGVREGAELDLAWKLLKTLTSTGALDIYAKAGRNNPARLSAGSAFQKPPDNLGIVQDILAGKLAGGHSFDVTTNWNQVKQLLGQDLPRTFLGQVSVTDAIAGLTPRLDILMRQHQDTVRQSAARKG